MSGFLQWLRSLPCAVAGHVSRAFWAMLGLDDLQQRALMTWGLLGAMVAISVGVMIGVDGLSAMFEAGTEAVRLQVADDLADTVKLAVSIIAFLGAGVVLIARGGEMSVKAPGGVEISARGAAATRELARSTDVNSITNQGGGDGSGG